MLEFSWEGTWIWLGNDKIQYRPLTNFRSIWCTTHIWRCGETEDDDDRCFLVRFPRLMACVSNQPNYCRWCYHQSMAASPIFCCHRRFSCGPRLKALAFVLLSQWSHEILIALSVCRHCHVLANLSFFCRSCCFYCFVINTLNSYFSLNNMHKYN